MTENHRDYARKIAKASLQMDKTFDDMMNGVDGADKRYENATKAFDTLSKSAKFSESTRSVNDVGASSFSKGCCYGGISQLDSSTQTTKKRIQLMR